MKNYSILTGDVLVGLASLPDASVQTCVTSPPYFGLRDYGTAAWEGGAADCDHKPPVKPRCARPAKGLHSLGYIDACQQPSFRDVCGLCGAIRVDQQIGLEDTPDAYVARLVAVFREVRRVLKDDGTLWLNLGDSYTGSAKSGGANQNDGGSLYRGESLPNKSGAGLKPKDLIGIPWRVAFALQADGWYLRQDIIWAKPNPMPESVRDRCTKAHEYVFLLAKSDRYLYNHEAVKEPVSSGRAPSRKAKRNGAGCLEIRGGSSYDGTETHRNKRSVWTVTPKPYKGAHFATMPPDLVEPCILAGSRPGDLVLDPFTGSGTTAVVALRNGRLFIGTELNGEFVTLAHERILNEGQPPPRLAMLPKAA